MLKMRAVAAVGGNCSPFIVQDTGSRLARIHHRLDGNHHALTQTSTVSADSEIRDLWLFVQPGTNAVSDKLPHHAEAVGLHVFLYRRPDIANRVTDPGSLNSPVERRFCYFQQLSQLLRDR